MKKGNTLRRLLVVLMVIFLCFGNATPLAVPTVIHAQAASVSISQKKANLVIGETLQLSVNGASKGVKWKTSNKKVASVSSSGVIKAKKKGKATITAIIGKKKYTCKVKVKIGLSEKTVALGKGESKTVSLKGAKAKSFKSKNTAVATVTKTGMITAVNEGTAKIVCTSKSGKKYSCKVKVTDPKINKTSTTILVGQSEQLSVSTSLSVSWKSSKTSIATVDKNGVVKGIKYGDAKITATAGSKSYYCDVQVRYDSNVIHTINFDTNGGTPATIAPQQVRGNDKVTQPAPPYITGKSFDGWYKDGQRYDFTTPVGSSFTLVARYSDISDNLTDDITDLGDIIYLQSQGVIRANYNKGGVVGAIDGKFTRETATDKASAASVLNHAKKIIAGSNGNFNADADNITVKQNDSGNGVENYYSVSQEKNGIPVIGNEVILSTKANGEVTGLFNNYDVRIKDVSTSTSINEEAAKTAAINSVKADEALGAYMEEHANETYSKEDLINKFCECLDTDARLVIYVPDEGENAAPALLYEVTVKVNYNKVTTASVSVDNDILMGAASVIGETRVLVNEEGEDSSVAETPATTEENATPSEDTAQTDEQQPATEETTEASSNAENTEAAENASDDTNVQQTEAETPVEEQVSEEEASNVSEEADDTKKSEDENAEQATEETPVENAEEAQPKDTENELADPTATTEEDAETPLEEKEVEPAARNLDVDDAAPVVPRLDRTYYIFANGSDAGTVDFVVDHHEGVSVSAKDHRDADRNIEVTKDGDNYKLSDTVRNIKSLKADKGSFLFYKYPITPGSFETFTEGNFNTKAVSAHANMEAVYDFYKNVLGRNSFDGNGAEIKVTYDYFNAGVWNTNYYNAYWTSDDQQFVIGNDGNLADGLDVLGHEFTHAVVNYVVGNGGDRTLTYHGESGAMNESYADIMGNLIEGKTGDDRWLLAEDTDETLRDMINPESKGDIGHYSNIYRGNEDNGGVHSNSGIFNKAAALMMSDSRTADVSRETWAKLFYNSLYELGTDSNFLAGRRAILYAANKLGFTADQTQAIKDAFDAVGITELNVVQITLTWGETPRDLDSHLVKLNPENPSGSKIFHVYYQNKTYKKDGELAADLDYDDTTSFGPENTTIYDMTPGVYYFFVHDYTTRDSETSTKMAQSNARVKMYKAGELQKDYFVSPDSAGTIWNVCRIEVKEDGSVEFTDKNIYSGGNVQYPSTAVLNADGVNGSESDEEISALMDEVIADIENSVKE